MRRFLVTAVALSAACGALPEPSDFQPVQAPDGSVVFASIPFDTGDAEIWRMSPGQSRTQLTHLAARNRAAFAAAGFHESVGKGISLHPTLSPDGRRLAFVGLDRSPAAAVPELLVCELADNCAAPRAAARFPSQRMATPAWSPDGERLAFVSDAVTGAYEIWEVRRDGTGLRQLTRSGFRKWAVSWAADETIAYGANPGDARRDDGTLRSDWRRVGHWSILFHSPEPGRAPEPLAEAGVDLLHPAWDRSGARLAFVRHAGAEWSVRVWDRDTGKTRVVTSSTRAILDVSWAVDQSGLLFTEARSGAFEGLFAGLRFRLVPVAPRG